MIVRRRAKQSASCFGASCSVRNTDDSCVKGIAVMSTETNKGISRRYFEAGHRNDLAAWDDLCDPNIVLVTGFTEPMQGLDAVRQFTAGMHSAFSNFFLTVDDLIAEGDRVAARWTTGGTHTAPMMTPNGPLPPTGKHVTMSGISIVRVVGGKIVEERVQADVLGMMQQLGVVPSPR